MPLQNVDGFRPPWSDDGERIARLRASVSCCRRNNDDDPFNQLARNVRQRNARRFSASSNRRPQKMPVPRLRILIIWGAEMRTQCARLREKERAEERNPRGRRDFRFSSLPHNHLFTTGCSCIVLAVAVVAEVSSLFWFPLRTFTTHA